MLPLYRLELGYLNEWIARAHRKPLVIRGARQVGKSTLVRLFAKEQQLDLIELDFEQKPENADLFNSKDPTIILALLSVKLGKDIDPKRTLLFLDEIQKTPSIIACLRYFYEQMPTLPVICAGSLLDLALADINFSIPVGRIDYLYLGPMSFQAFLLALGKKQLLDFIKNYKLSDILPLSLHQSLLDLLKIYYIVGGLPESVARYVATSSFIESERTKQALLQAYQEDFSKYASRSRQQHMRLLFHKIPRMLGEKFKYSNVSREEKSTTIKEALDSLSLARIITQVNHTDANGLPLGAEVNEKYFKIYFLDVGLGSSVLDLNILSFPIDQDLVLVNSGKISEQFIAQHLLHFRSLNESPALYYWHREVRSASAEIDFVVAFGGKVIPIEVKAGTSGSLKSLHYFLRDKDLNWGVRFCSQRPSVSSEQVTLSTGECRSYQLLSLPLYLVEELARFLSEVMI